MYAVKKPLGIKLKCLLTDIIMILVAIGAGSHRNNQ